MASISDDGEGRRLLFSFGGKRRTIRLGPVTSKTATEIKGRVERIIEAREAGVSLDGETARWLGSCGDKLAAKLAKAGLCESRAISAIPTLGEWFEQLLKRKTHFAANTVASWGTVRNHLYRLFGERTQLDKITIDVAAKADAVMRADEAISEASRSKIIKIARQIFKAAIKEGLIGSNPFSDIQRGNDKNRSRQAFVAAETVNQLLESLPSVEWRLAVALARWGGLRMPSEGSLLQWSHVVWDRERLVIPCPKLKRFAGKDERVIPLFPELRRILDEAFALAEPGAVYLLPTLRVCRGWPTLLRKRITSAGLTPWLKPWQNLRATRATELADLFPSHVCAAWLGHSEKIADEHYRQVTDEHFARATGAKSGAPKSETAQKPAQ